MKISAKLAPPNSVALIKDSGEAEIPGSMSGALIVSTTSCIAVSCLSEMDGQTAFVLGPAREVDPGYPAAFNGKLATSSRRIAIQTVLGETVLQQEVSEEETVVQIWVNDRSEPDSVIVGVA